MKEEQEGPERSEALLSTWMKAANDLGSMMKTWLDSSSSDASPADEKEGQAKVKMKEAMDSVHSSPETVSQMSRLGFEAYANLQKQWLDYMSRIGKVTEGPKAEEVDQDPLKAWMQIYEKEYRPFFTMPQLGLTRFYQERMAQAMDQFNLYQAAMGNFYNLLYRPMEQSNRVLQEKLSSSAEGGNGPEGFQEYYRLWVKTLEGHYMTLFKSPEFTQSLAETLKALENFMQARQAVLQDLLKLFQVPTHKDLDDVCQELYLMKKKVKELEKRLTEEPIKKKKPAKNKLSDQVENGHLSK